MLRKTPALLLLLLLAPAPTGPGKQRWLLSVRATLDREPLRAAILAEEPAAGLATRIEVLTEAAVERDRELEVFVRGLGGRMLRSFWLCDVCLVELPGSIGVADLVHPDLWRVDRDEPVGMAAALPLTDRSIDARNHCSSSVHGQGIRGKGVTVAILDTGQDEDMDGKGRPHALYYLQGNVANKSGNGLSGSRLLENQAIGAQEADDVGFHGTAVCGVLAGARWNKHPRAADGQAPEASILGYAIADTPSGTTTDSTLIKAWEKVVTDIPTYGTKVVNNSYLGDPDPLHPVQQALDSAALTGDLLITVPAGNLGAATTYSQSAANGLAVGATHPDTRHVALFSSRGPLLGDPGRDYPDLCANGANLWMPLTDDESGHYVTWGTSMAAPQVAGAAALFLGVATKADALQCKAAILATTDDVSAENPSPPYDSIQAYGQGYLRSDRLVALAQTQGALAGSSLDSSHRSRDLKFSAVKDARYAVVLAWPRQDLKTKAWADLSLRVYDGSTLLGKADRPRNLYEKLEFVAPRGGTMTVRVTASSTPAKTLPFAVAFVEQTTTHRSGTIRIYGDSCGGTGKDEGVRVVVPGKLEQDFGSAWSHSLLGDGKQRFQQLIDHDQLPKPFTAKGLALRHDEQVVFAEAEYWIELELKLGSTKVTPAAMSSTFATNASSSLTTVFDKKRVVLPVIHGTNPSPKEWLVRLPFDRDFAWAAKAGEHLLLEGIKTDSEDVTRPLYYFIDAFYDRQSTLCSVLASDKPDGTTGLLAVGSGLVLGFLGDPAPEAWPRLDAGRVPQIGEHTELRLGAGLGGSAAALFFGLDDTLFNSIPLPAQLGPLGAPNCWSLASIEHMHGLPLDQDGNGSVDLPLPRDPALIGGKLFSQAAVLDGKANKLGLVLTNAVELVIGGDR